MEITERGENLRFVVTALQGNRPAIIYRIIYCGRGRMENFIAAAFP